MKKSEFTRLLGYEASPELKRKILSDVKTKGIPIEAAIDQYTLPPLFILDDDGTFTEEGETFTVESFKTRFPHRRFYIITGPKDNED